MVEEDLTWQGIKWIVLGHSERRVNFNESNEQIADKIKKA